MRIRLATPADGAACAAIYRPSVEAVATSFELEAPDAAEMAARIGRTLARTPWLVAEVDGTAAGYAYAGRHRERPAYDWTAETTVYVGEAFAGRGVGRALMEAVLGVLVLQGFRLAVAGVTLPNPASVGLHRALGFEPVGTFPSIGWKVDRWWSTAWFARELGPRTGPPAPIRPLPELLGTPELDAILAAAAQGRGRAT